MDDRRPAIPRFPASPTLSPTASAVGGSASRLDIGDLSAAEYYDAADVWPLDPDGNILLMGIVEEPTGVQNLPDILRQVKGIGAIWAGPGDMSVAMGHRGNAGHPEVQEMLLRILATCKDAGVPCATGCTAAEVPMRLEQGFSIIITAPSRSADGLAEGRRLAGR